MSEQPSRSHIKSQLLDAIIEKENFFSFSIEESRIEESRDSSLEKSLEDV